MSPESGSFRDALTGRRREVAALEQFDRLRVLERAVEKAIEAGAITRGEGAAFRRALLEGLIFGESNSDTETLAPGRTAVGPADALQLLGLTAESLAEAAAAVQHEDVIAMIRGPLAGDGVSRATEEGMYYQLNVPDQAEFGRSASDATRSWRSWVSGEPGISLGLGGGWHITDRAGDRWIDFWRRPYRDTGDPLVYRLIEDLADPSNARLAIEQLVRVAAEPAGRFLDVSLTLASVYREFGRVAFPKGRRRGQIISTDRANGLDLLGGELSRLKAQNFLRDGFPATPMFGIDDRGERIRPALIRMDSIIEATAAMLSYRQHGRDQFLEQAVTGGFLPDEGGTIDVSGVDRRALRLWSNASLSEPLTISCILLPPERRSHPCGEEWPEEVTRDLSAVVGNEPFQDLSVAFKSAHIGTGDAEILDSLVTEPARDLAG